MSYVGKPIGLKKFKNAHFARKKLKKVCHIIIKSKVKPKIQY